MATCGLRDSGGRFYGLRVDVEDVPRIPARVARYVLDDRRARPYLVVWTDRVFGQGERVGLALRAEPRDGDRVRFLSPRVDETVGTVRVPIAGGRAALLWRCPTCGVGRRFLYVHRLSTWGLRTGFLGCARCNRLRWNSQGRFLGDFARAMRGNRRRLPLPRQPWEPAAVVSSPAGLSEIDPRLAALLSAPHTGRAPRHPTARTRETVGRALGRISARLATLEGRFSGSVSPEKPAVGCQRAGNGGATPPRLARLLQLPNQLRLDSAGPCHLDR